MNSYKRIVALDVGSKRTGLAQSDPMHVIASPIGAFGTRELIEKLQKLHEDSGIECIVLGWPVGQNGQLGASTDRVITLSKKLEKILPGIALRFIDERFTSVMAKQQLFASGMKKKKRQEKARVDATAACIILQEYLDYGERATILPTSNP